MILPPQLQELGATCPGVHMTGEGLRVHLEERPVLGGSAGQRSQGSFRGEVCAQGRRPGPQGAGKPQTVDPRLKGKTALLQRKW